MDSRARIMRAAASRGVVVDYCAAYSRPLMLSMGDGLGGWRVTLRDGRQYGGTCAAVVEWLMGLPMRLSTEEEASDE